MQRRHDRGTDCCCSSRCWTGNCRENHGCQYGYHRQTSFYKADRRTCKIYNPFGHTALIHQISCQHEHRNRHDRPAVKTRKHSLRYQNQWEISPSIIESVVPIPSATKIGAPIRNRHKIQINKNPNISQPPLLIYKFSRFFLVHSCFLSVR